jgi:hypothetical protein
VYNICTNILQNIDNRPKIDPYIIMEDNLEKLRLLNYEKIFCKKFNKPPVNKFYFAYNMNQKNEYGTSIQFIYFYELSNWLISLIKQVYV